MTSRLESLSLLLANEFRKASLDRQRRAALEACTIAVAQADLESGEVDAALEFLRNGNGDRSVLEHQIRALTAKFDDNYFMLSDEDNEEAQSDALRMFSKARATSALLYALSGNPEELHEAVYEALASSDDMTRVLAVVQDALH